MSYKNYSIANHKQGGFLLVAALGFIILFSILAFFLSQQLTASSRVQLLSILSMQASNAAYSGAQEGLYRLSHAGECATSVQRSFDDPGLRQCRVLVKCIKPKQEGKLAEEGFYQIAAQAQCGSKNLHANRRNKVSLLLKQQNNSTDKLHILYRLID